MRSFWYPRGYQILHVGHILHAIPRRTWLTLEVSRR